MAKTKEQKKALKELDLKQKKKFKINKTTLIVLAAILVVVGIWGVRYLIKYALYNGYEKYITDYDYVEGTEFVVVKEEVETTKIADKKYQISAKRAEDFKAKGFVD